MSSTFVFAADWFCSVVAATHRKTEEEKSKAPYLLEAHNRSYNKQEALMLGELSDFFHIRMAFIA